MDYIVSGLTALIGFLVIAAALYLNMEKSAKAKYTPIAQPGKKKRKKKSSFKKKVSGKKKSSSKKVSTNKSSSKKKKAAAAAPAPAPVETKTTTKKKKDTIAGTSNDGKVGMFASSSEKWDKREEGWVTLERESSKPSNNKKTDGAESKDDRTSRQITVNNLGKLIGRGGETIHRISDESGAKIDTPDRGSGNKVTVSGTAEQVAAAIAIITDEIGDDSSALKPAFSTTIPVNNVGKLIGKGGETIRRLSEGGARIDTPKQRKDTGNMVNVSGATQEIVDQCVAAINEVLGDDDATPRAFKTIPIKTTQRALIIGRGGETINKIKSDSGVSRIDLDKMTGECKVSGSQAAVDAAVKAIRAILIKDADTVTEIMDCDAGRFGLVIGRGGETIRAVQKEFDVQINTDAPNNQIKIRGSKKNAKAAVAKYTALLAKQKAAGPFGPLADGAKFEIIQVADNLKGRVIGTGGSSIKKLQADTGAKIDFARKGSDAGCRISGTDEQITHAKKLIDEIKAEAKRQDEKAEGDRAKAAEDADEAEADAGSTKEAEFVALGDDDEATGTGW